MVCIPAPSIMLQSPVFQLGIVTVKEVKRHAAASETQVGKEKKWRQGQKQKAY